MKSIVPFLLILLLASLTSAQQLPDTSFSFDIRQPAYPEDKGPVIFIDQAHYNFHTMEGNFIAFAKLLKEDGYQVKPLNSYIRTPEALNGCKILVIANALHYSNIQNWTLPTPSAFTKEEIAAIKLWVKNGGSLLLIADHMPFAGAAFDLGKAFGFEFINGFAFEGSGSWPPIVFTQADKTLPSSPLSNGIQPYERIDTVTTFTGSAFFAPTAAIPVLSFSEERHVSFQPDTAWRFNAYTPWENLKGYYQGALRKCGKGKVAVFGEAAMFTAQIVQGSVKVGFNSEWAPQNAQFTINLIHWLDGVTEYQGEKR